MIKKPTGKKQKIVTAPNSRKSTAQQKHPISYHAIAILTVIVILGLSIVAFLDYSGISSSIRLTFSSEDIRQQMTSARKTLEPKFDIEQEERLETLYRAGVISSPIPTHSAKIDKCTLYSKTKEKFTTINWTQHCTIRYADVLETSLTRDQILEKLTADNDTSQIFGQPTTYTASLGATCDNLYYDERHTSTLNFLDWSRGNNLRCQLYNPSTELSTANVLHTYNSADVIREKSYLTVTKDNEYFVASLGCGKKDLFGCEKPTQDPITDFTKK
ncbi:MAG TPA: hypothetical protein VF281_02430 [Candidatus Saccharimonadales bacterium]